MLNMLLISAAHAQEAAGTAAATGTPPSPLSSMIPLVFIFVVFYFLLIRPQQKKYKEHQAMIAATKVGDKVITGGGIHGKVTKIKDSVVTVRIAEGVEIEVERSTLSSIVDKTAKDAGAKASNDN